MEWFEAVEKVAPYVVKIETPRGHGTGFLCLFNGNRNLCGIATAFHVVEHADEWQEPIRLVHDGSPAPAFLTEGERVIFSNEGNDSAGILFPPGKLHLPQDLIPLIPVDRFAKVGVEVGWLGYPSVAPQNLCFFTGNISATATNAYFIDGVAINGVSGGPVFYRWGKDIFILGTISAYYPNVRGTGNTLPGLSFAQGVAHFHQTIAQIRSLEEAREAQKEQSDTETLVPPDATEPPKKRGRPAKKAGGPPTRARKRSKK